MVNFKQTLGENKVGLLRLWIVLTLLCFIYAGYDKSIWRHIDSVESFYSTGWGAELIDHCESIRKVPQPIHISQVNLCKVYYNAEWEKSYSLKIWKKVIFTTLVAPPILMLLGFIGYCAGIWVKSGFKKRPRR